MHVGIIPGEQKTDVRYLLESRRGQVPTVPERFEPKLMQSAYCNVSNALKPEPTTHNIVMELVPKGYT